MSKGRLELCRFIYCCAGDTCCDDARTIALCARSVQAGGIQVALQCAAQNWYLQALVHFARSELEIGQVSGVFVDNEQSVKQNVLSLTLWRVRVCRCRPGMPGVDTNRLRFDLNGTHLLLFKIIFCIFWLGSVSVQFGSPNTFLDWS